MLAVPFPPISPHFPSIFPFPPFCACGQFFFCTKWSETDCNFASRLANGIRSSLEQRSPASRLLVIPHTRLSHLLLVGQDCKDIKSRDSAAANGQYTLANGVTVYCDMTGLDGTGWTLIAVKSNTAKATETTGAVHPSDTGKVLSDVNWLALRQAMATVGAALVFVNSGTQNFMSAPVLLLPSVDRLWTGNCRTFALSLTEFPWAHNENGGCTGTGSDYSFIMGCSNEQICAKRQNYFTDISSMKYGLQMCTSATLGSSCSPTGNGYYEYATTTVYVQLYSAGSYFAPALHEPINAQSTEGLDLQ